MNQLARHQSVNCLPKPNLPKHSLSDYWMRGRIIGRQRWTNPVHASAIGMWEWKEFKEDLVLSCSSILPFTQTEEHLIKVPLKDVAWKGKQSYPRYCLSECPCCDGLRSQGLDLSFPIIISDMGNPHNDKYRCLDGNHRCATFTALGHTHVWAFFLPFSLLKQYFTYG